MKLYLTHSSGYDYEAELYTPLKMAFANEHSLFLPHELRTEGVKSKDIIPNCDLILAEVTLPSTGQGIELGWADSHGVPVVCFYKAGSSPSSSLRFISANTVKYHTLEDMIAKLRTEIQKFV